jgi:putative solute:sodium symporter small subunit
MDKEDKRWFITIFIVWIILTLSLSLIISKGLNSTRIGQKIEYWLSEPNEGESK